MLCSGEVDNNVDRVEESIVSRKQRDAAAAGLCQWQVWQITDSNISSSSDFSAINQTFLGKITSNPFEAISVEFHFHVRCTIKWLVTYLCKDKVSWWWKSMFKFQRKHQFWGPRTPWSLKSSLQSLSVCMLSVQCILSDLFRFYIIIVLNRYGFNKINF